MMEHILAIDEKGQSLLENIFESITEGNTVLILGAGVSVGEKKYLSKQIIDYYEDKKGISYNISDIKEFVDVLEKTKAFSRREFDQYVYDLLNNLKVTEIHKTIATIPWRQIITTNYDLLIEKAFDEIKRSCDFIKEIAPIRSIKEFNNLTANDQTKYVKLHGCMSDKTEYPFVFSTADFLRVKKYYRTVLSNLKSPSDKIKILCIGYSFSDSFGYSILKTIDEDSFRDKRWLINVDPNVNENMLDYYTESKIAIIKLTAEEFFKHYKIWEEKKYRTKHNILKGTPIRNSNNEILKIPSKLRYKLDFSLKQLDNQYRGDRNITEKDFLLGEEPTYEVAIKNYDIIKDGLASQIKQYINTNINNDKSSLIPIFCLVGGFGVGKTTDSYRIIKTIVDDSESSTIAFEIVDFETVRYQDYLELINQVNTKNIIFYTDNIEVDSVFKSLLNLRTELSIQQISSVNIIFLVSVRENILHRYKSIHDYKNLFEFKLPATLEDGEINEFLTRLSKNDLVSFRDLNEKEVLIEKIKNNYNGDAFISLVELVSQGRHKENLRDAYFQLSKDCQKAFIYTALLHRFNLLMPSYLLRNLVSRDWDDFKKNVIEVEGKGILVQEEIKSKDLDPDLYFKTKHPIIADLLVEEILKTREKKFEFYSQIIRKSAQTSNASKLITNLLKALNTKGEISHEKIYKLFDEAYERFQDEPYFILNYSINLQRKGDRDSLIKALKLLVYAEGLLERRNNRFIHRRGVISFDLAKLYYKKEEETELNLCLKYLQEAEDLLELKQTLDPCSSFSYASYLDVLIWKLDNFNLEKEEELSLNLQIEELYDSALGSVTEGLNRIIEIYTRYKSKFHSTKDTDKYLSELEEMYQNESTRPYACILYYKFYDENEIEYENKEAYIEEMENYTYINDVSKFLFRYYSSRLNYTTYRIKFFDLTKRVNKLKDFRVLLYNYYMFIAESYSLNFSYAFDYIKNLDKEYVFLNPDYQQIWKEPDSDDNRIFIGTLVRHNGNYMFKAYENQNRFIIKRGNKFSHVEGTTVKAQLHFYFHGIRAEILPNENTNEY